MRYYKPFTYKEANFRICSIHFELIKNRIIQQRNILDEYLELHPDFRTSLKPVNPAENAPEIAARMHSASVKTGVGPMAAVAGAFSQIAAETALNAGAKETVIENGGDIYLYSDREIIIGIYAGSDPVAGGLAFCLTPDYMPLGICSSSSSMGTSLSFGNCDLATVTSKDACLADAAATLACNLVKNQGDIDKVLKRISAIPGIEGVLLIKGDKIGVAGDLPELVKHQDEDIFAKITRDKRSIIRNLY